ALLRQRFARQYRVDAQPAVFRKSEHPIIPPSKNAGFVRMQPQSVAQTDFAKLLKHRALVVRAHDRAAPELWIVNIDIFRRDIKIAADNKSAIRTDSSIGETAIFLFRQ